MTIEPALKARIIEVLDGAKHEHYSSRSGLRNCVALSTPPGDCDCGAAEINAEIDALIKELNDGE